MVHIPVQNLNQALSLTTPSLSQVTPGPSPEHVELNLKRQQNGPTCGYMSGDSASPITCRRGFSCTRGIYGEFGCCNELECDNFAQACIDPAQPSCVVAGYEIVCNMFSYTTSCDVACVTHLLKAPNLYTTDTYTSWSCGSTPATKIALVTPTNGPGGGGDEGSNNEGGIDVNDFLPGASTTAGSNGGSDSGSSGSSNSNGDNNSSNDVSNSSGSGGGLGAGAIAGVAVGSAVGALLIAFVIWKFCRRSKRPPPPNYSQTVVSGWLDQTH